MGLIGRALDAVIAELAPEAGHRRSAARQAMAVSMNYDAASRGRRTQGWKAPATDADAAAFGARPRLRQLSRDMVRNRPYAARAREVVVANVVGTGIVPSVVHGDQEMQAKIWEVLEGHLLTPALDARGELDLYAMQETVIGTVFTDGEVLARRRIRRGKFARDLPLGFQVELLEADHLDDTITSWGQNEVIEGIEYSPIGDIEAYHLFPEHPGATRLRGHRLKSDRVSWRDVLHVRRMDRPGQLRGVPWLAPVMMTLGEVSDYQEAQILKQKMAALLTAIITYDKDAGAGAAKFKGLEKMEPGAIVGAPEGSSVTFTTPPKIDDYQVFMREAIGAIAMGVGITRESLSGDLSGVNFSSGRMGRMEMDRNVERWQRMVILQFCAGIERWCREAWRMLPDEALARADWTMKHTAPRRPLIDPNDEIDAMLKQIEGGVTSRQTVQRTLGLDPERIRRERVEDEKADADNHLAPATTPTPAPARASRAAKAQQEKQP